MNSKLEIIGVLLLLGCYFLQGLYSLPTTSKTYDEGIHLIGGFTFWTYQDFRLHPENGNLPQRWASLPMLLMDAPDFPTDDRSWRYPDGWLAEQTYLYQMPTEPVWFLFLGRVMMLLATTAIGLMVYIYARRLFGIAGGFIALSVFAFHPETLAHGRLITSDMIGAGAYLLSLWGLGLLLVSASIGRILMLGIAVGLLTVSKNHAALFAPVAAISLIAVCAYSREYALRMWRRGLVVNGWWRVLCLRLCALVAAAVIAWGVLWSFYGFRYAAFNPELPAPEQAWDWDRVLANDSASAKVVSAVRESGLLPEAYLFGVAHILKGSEVRHGFLMGDYTYDGWWGFFPLALLFKTPVALILLAVACAISIYAYLKRTGRQLWLKPELAEKVTLTVPLIVLMGIYALVAGSSAFNIGLRYLMPVIVCGVVAMGALAFWWRKSRWGRYTISTLLGLFALESALAFPHYLSFFNRAVGGPENGYRLLVDSSLDWGQDLGALAEWLAEHNSGPEAKPVYLGYFGNESPRYAGIDARYLTSNRVHRDESYQLGTLEPGYYVLSATMLQGMYYQVARPWTEEHTEDYVKLYQEMARLDIQSGDAQTVFLQIMHSDPRRWLEVMETFEALRAESLRLYLIEQEPVARINHSIFVYELTADDLQTAVLDAQFGFPEDFPYGLLKAQIELALERQAAN